MLRTAAEETEEKAASALAEVARAELALEAAVKEEEEAQELAALFETILAEKNRVEYELGL